MKRILFFDICVFMLLCMAMPCTTFAVEDNSAKVYADIVFSDDGSVQYSDDVLQEGTFDEIVEYLNYSREKGGIVLSRDVKLSRGVTLQPVQGRTSYILIDGNVKLDLNGYFITQLSGGDFSENPAIIVPEGSTLTVTDSSKTEKGVINGVQRALGIWGGKVVLEKGCIKAQSQASANIDEYEQPVQIKNGGNFTVNGGTVLYSGALNDDRLYKEGSCAISADETGQIIVNGGVIDGEIQIAKPENLYINGGAFGFDISTMIPDAYEVIENDGLYIVKKVMPIVEVNTHGKLADITVDAEYGDTEELITKYKVSVLNDAGDIRQIKFEISDLIRSALAKGYNEVPIVEFVTDFAVVVLDGDDIRAMYSDSYNKKLYFVLEKNFNLSDGIYDKLSGAKYEIIAKFINEDGDLVAKNAKPELNILHFASDVAKLYTVSGSTLFPKNATAETGSIVCEISNNERLVVSEGSVVMITGRTLDLQGTISMIFYASLEGVNSADAKMLFWEEEQSEYTEETADRIVSYSGKDANGYRFKYENISSKDMNKNIYARLMAKDAQGNTIYSKVPDGSYSVVTYAENMMKNAKLKPLLVKMLNYGAAAQQYFGSEDALANSVLTEAQRVTDFTKIYRSKSATVAEDTINGKCQSYIAGKTLMLEGDISINYYVKSDEKVDEVGILFWTEDAYEETKSHVVGTQSRAVRTYTSNGAYKVFSYDNIISRQMFESVYARVYTRTGNVYKYGDIDKYSVKDYAANQIEKNDNPGLIKLLRCLLLYGDEAEKYFRLNS